MLGLSYKNFTKRLFDILSASCMVLLLSPVLIVVALLVRARLGSPVLFKQERLGLKGQTFTIWKFRSMTECRDAEGNFLEDRLRLTPFGKLLRDWSLDELPQLWNVLVGDMSLIGPRPFIAEYASRYTNEQMRRHEVRPGISGWAQITGRNAISWNQKFILDVWYVDNCSALLDIKILLLTVPKVLFKAGVTADNHVTMPKWTGDEAPAEEALSE